MPDGGVYALSLEDGGKALCLAVPLSAAAFAAGAPGVMHVATVGRWEGHPDGPFEFTAELFDKLIDRFNTRGASALMVDYDHRYKGKKGTPEENKASGWIRSLWRQGNDLMAAVDFTPAATELIAAQEYKYCSPVVAWGVADKRTAEVGPELLRAALTNDPFQDGLGGVQLMLSDSRELAAPPFKAKGDEETPAEEQAPPEEGEPAEGDAPAEDAPPQEEPPPDGEGNSPPAEAEGPADPLMDLATELGIDRGTVCAVFKANMGVFAKAIGDALEKQRQEQTMATPQTQPPAPQGQPAQPKQTAMSADERISKLEKQLSDERASRVAERVNVLISEGYGTEAMRGYITHELSRNLGEGEAAIRANGKVVPVGETQAGNRDQVTHKGSVKELTAAERFIHDQWVSTRTYSSKEAVNRLLARRDGAGKAA